jgi:phage tail-like protein
MSMGYHLLLGERDWQPLIEAGGEDVAWDRERRQLMLAPELLRFPARGSERVYEPADRRGAAADGFGHLYWIDTEGSAICYRPAGSARIGLLWSVEALRADCPATFDGGFRPVAEPTPSTLRLRGLTVTTRGYLVVGTLAPAGLLVLDLHGSGPAVWQRWPDAALFAPFDLAAAPDGGLWVLDLPVGADPRLWYLDSALRIGSPPGAERIPLAAARTDTFHALGEAPRIRLASSAPAGIPLVLDLPPAETTPVAIEALPDGTLLLLDQGPLSDGALIHRLDRGIATAAPVALVDELRSLLPDQPGFIGHDLAFLAHADGSPTPAGLSGTLFVASAEGNQSFAFLVSTPGSELRIEATSRYLPMRRFAGKALVSGPGEVSYDQDDTWLMLTELPRPRYARAGRLLIPGAILDGKEPQCRWHRLFIDACIPPGDAIGVESRAADDTDELQRAIWQTEQPLYLRRISRHELPTDQDGRTRLVDEGERPFHRPFDGDSLGHKGVGTWELLFQQTSGRYLELRLTLSGSGRSSPKVRALRVYYPRLSYPRRFLPAVYREDPVSASFLERFLAIFEGFYTELEARIATAQTLFDSRTVPAEALDWLASWVGAALAEDWDETRRRLFIRHAVELYRQRGTARGLARAIRLATEPCPDERLFDSTLDATPFGIRIVEHFANRALPSTMWRDSGTLLPSRVPASMAWEPSQGGARLHRLWREYLLQRYASEVDAAALLAALSTVWDQVPSSLGGLRFWPLTPADAAHARDRRAFIDARLRLTYADLGADDAPLYRDYLRRKHGSVAALNKAYGLAGKGAYSSFDTFPMPPEDLLPADGAALEDWLQFATVDMPAARAAHRFTVLVPVEPRQDLTARQALLDRVLAVVERERPSHASFDVQPYWALFRVGSARAGLDTVLGEGSRLTALVLNAGYLGEGLLGEHHPWNLTDRWVNGRDGVGNRAIGQHN